MKLLGRTFNFASPYGWILAMLALAAFGGLLIVAAGGVGFRFDPFRSAEKRAVNAEATAVVAVANGSARSIEAAGANDTTARVETAHVRIRAADAIITQNTPAAEAAPDANLSLETDRADRIHDVDRELCALRPSVCPGGSAASADAGDGDGLVRPRPPAGGSLPL